MKITHLSLTILAVFALILSFAAEHAEAQIDESETLVETWLIKSCDAGEELQLQNEIVQKGSSLEPAFIEAYKNGPDPKLISEVESTAGRTFDKRAQMLESGETFGLSEEDLEVVKSTTREDYINQEKEAFVLRYKSQALNGIGFVGDQTGYELLKEISSDTDSPMQITAQQALKNIKYEELEPEQEETEEESEKAE